MLGLLGLWFTRSWIYHSHREYTWHPLCKFYSWRKPWQLLCHDHCYLRASVTSVPLLHLLPPYHCYLRTSVTSVPLLSPYHCYLRTSVASVSLLLLHSFESPTVQDTYFDQLLTPVSCCKLTGKPSSSLLHEHVHVWSCNQVSSHWRAFFQDYTSLFSGMKILCIVSWRNLMQEHYI